MLFGCNPNDQAMGKGIAFVCSSKPENGIAKYLKSKLMDLHTTLSLFDEQEKYLWLYVCQLNSHFPSNRREISYINRLGIFICDQQANIMFY
jgi:hypothetical protein